MSKPKFKISCEAKDNKAVIRIDGYISMWNNHSEGFKASLDALIEQGITDADIYINTPGGDCFQANEIVNEIKRFTGLLTGRLGALCASAGTYIASNCGKVIIAKNTSYMIHKPMGGVEGNSDEVKSVLKVLENLEKLYAAAYAKKTGLTVAEIQKMWATDYWMDSDECIEKGFADEIEGEAEITNDDIEAISAYKGAPKIAATAKKNPLINTNQISTEMKELLLTMSGLPATSTDMQIVAYFEGLKTKASKADGLQAKLTELENTAKDDKAESVAEAAVVAKKITALQKPFYKKNLVADFDATKALIDAMPALSPLSAQITPSGKDGAIEDRSAWTYKDYQDKNPKALALLAKEDDARFRMLFEAHYGVKLS